MGPKSGGRGHFHRRGQGVQEALELELSLVLMGLTRMWTLMEDKRGRRAREKSMEPPGMFGDWRGVGCWQSTGCEEAYAGREAPGGCGGSWWVLQAFLLHNMEHCWIFSFRTCTSAARVENGWEGPVRRLGIIWAVIAAV